MIGALLPQLTYLRINEVLVYAGYAVSLNLLFGCAGQFSVAQAAFGAIGGYTFGYMATTLGVNGLVAILVGAVGAFVLGGLVGIIASRSRSDWVILLTFAISAVVLDTIPQLNHPNLGGEDGLLGLNTMRIFGHSIGAPSQFFPVALIALAVVVVVSWRCARSPYGRALRGLREDATALRSLGVNATRYQVEIFAIAGALAAIAGAMTAMQYGLATTSNYQFSVTIEIFAMVIIGGAGNLLGSVLGAAIVVLIQPLLQDVIRINPSRASSWQLIVFGVLLLGILRFKPRGLLKEPVQRLTGSDRWLSAVRRGHDPGTRSLGPTSLPAAVSPGNPGDTADAGRAAPSSRNPRVQASRVWAHSDPPPPALEVEGLSKAFGGVAAVVDLSFVLPRGKVTALVGPNGAGKTTVFNLITGTIPVDQGRVRLNGTDITGLVPNRVVRLGMARSFQNVRTFARLTALENVMLAVGHQPGMQLGPLFLRPRAVSAAEEDVRERAEHWLDYVGLRNRSALPAASLSFGEQKLLSLARVMATECDVLLLDEPASGIDAQWVDAVVGLIAKMRSEGRTICIVEHNLRVVEGVADETLFMELGTVTARGQLSELLQRGHLAEAYFGSA